MGWTYNLATAKRFGGGANLRDVWTFPIERNNRRHPAQKPLGMLDRIVRLITRPNDLICDPFAGSGTTLLAARNAGRHYIGCDISADYCAIARERLALPFTLPLFADAPAPSVAAAVQESFTW